MAEHRPGDEADAVGGPEVSGDQFRIVDAQFFDSARGSLSTGSVVVPEPGSTAQLISGLTCIGLFGILRGSKLRRSKALMPTRRH